MSTAINERACTRPNPTSVPVASSPRFGLYSAKVSDLRDPDELGRVKVCLHDLLDPNGSVFECWARMATLMTGKDRGSWFCPEVDDEVLVAFEGGDLRRPCVVGALWNGMNRPPENRDLTGHNNKKLLRSRSGLQITLDDSEHQEQIALETPHGQKLALKDGPGQRQIVLETSGGHRLTLDDGPGQQQIVLETAGGHKLTLDDSQGQQQIALETSGGQSFALKDGPGSIELVNGNGNTVQIAPTGITVKSSSTVTVKAPMVDITASMVKVDAGLTQFTGIVQAATVIANTVIGASWG